MCHLHGNILWLHMWHSPDQHTALHTLQYKFVVDGEWKYAPDQAAMYDEGGNVNNVLEVQEYVPENLDSLSGFDPPPSPPSRSVPKEERGLDASL